MLTYPHGAGTASLPGGEGTAGAVDTGAFERRLQPLLADGFRVAVAILRDREAEDALQDAAFDAWKNRGRFRGDARSMRAWFLTIVANRCRARFRTSWWRRGRPVGADPSLDELEGRRHDAAVELRADLARAMARLTWNQRAPAPRVLVRLRSRTAFDGPSGPTIKGGAMPKIETIDGSQYLFGYSGSQVVVAMWKSVSGVTVTARFAHPIDHAAAVALVTHLQ